MRWILTPILAANLLFSNTVFADVPSYELTKEKSTLKFFVIQNNAPVEGAFKNFTTDIHFDPQQLDKSSIAVEVDTGSVTAADDEVTQNMKASDWLSTDAFPKAVFKSTKITRLPQSDNYYADGELTLRDKTVPIVLNFQLNNIDEKVTVANGSATLSRNSFGVGQGEWAKDDVIKNQVRVEFRIVAEKK